ncbi:unnamed protein product [Blepharisma stoltei]|uniref:Uncharacterized protein n=1 Tax=Blepharisma stoltei TaxID=1481888 RepID=A0AAU9JJ53_9CILI|nr:unnamed protein product [Blepharisma stoltei]
MEEIQTPTVQPASSKDPAIQIADQEVKDASPIHEETPDPDTLFFQGLEDLKSNLFDIAVERLGKSLEIKVARQGELSADLYKNYYHYADAILHQYEANQDSQLFGEEIPEGVVYSDEENFEMGSPQNVENEGKSDESGESGSESDRENSAENCKNEVLAENNETPLENNEAPAENNEAPAENNEAPAENNEMPVESNEGNNPVENDEDEDDLQLAWENLETCRVILNLHQNDLHYLFLTHVRLGDLQTWKELFEEACHEYQEALSILFRIQGEAPSRRKAELFFLIGTTFLNQPGKEKDAAQNFILAVGQLEGTKETICDAAEAKEIDELMNEIKMKIDDALEQEQSINILKSQTMEEPEDFSAPTIVNGEVQDLGVLGKRKREKCENADPNVPENMQEGNECKKSIEN